MLILNGRPNSLPTIEGKAEIATPSPFQIHYGSVVLPENATVQFPQEVFFQGMNTDNTWQPIIAAQDPWLGIEFCRVAQLADTRDPRDNRRAIQVQMQNEHETRFSTMRLIVRGNTPQQEQHEAVAQVMTSKAVSLAVKYWMTATIGVVLPAEAKFRVPEDVFYQGVNNDDTWQAVVPPQDPWFGLEFCRVHGLRHEVDPGNGKQVVRVTVQNEHERRLNTMRLIVR